MSVVVIEVEERYTLGSLKVGRWRGRSWKVEIGGWKEQKSKTPHACLRQAGKYGEGHAQARFYDFNVYSRGKVKEKVNFSMRDRTAVNMHANPVIRKLVKHAKDWPWSSWSQYMKGEKGLMEIDVA